VIKEKTYFVLIIFVIVISSIASNKININRKIEKINVIVNISKSKFLNDSIVNKLLTQKIKIEDIKSNLELDLNELEEYLELQPEIASAEVFSYPEGEINAIIFERTPILRIHNQGFYLDNFSSKIPFSDNYIPKVPVYTGYFEEKKIDQIVDITKIMIQDKFFKNEFVEIWNEKLGYVLRFRNYDFEIFWGDLSKPITKSKKLKAFCAYYANASFNKKIKRIDLTVLDQVVVTH
tara:strand:- start:2905 stop:3609 length:705 start_codon:yes stop_codon:yes gene_type:complete